MASLEEAVLKTMVAKICDYVGYNAITLDSVNILVDVYRKTFIHLARHCKEAANNNRRVEPTLPDLIQAYNFVGISIPGLIEHAENVKIPLDLKFEVDAELKSANRIQRDLFVDDLLETERKQDGATGDSEEVGDKDNEIASDEDDNTNMTPLLKDIYNEISTQFPKSAEPVKADKMKIKREEKPIIPKLKIPLDPSIAEPPSFLPILGNNPDEQASFAASSSRPTPPPLFEKAKRGRQKGTKLKLKPKIKSGTTASAKASAKAVAKAKGKTGPKISTTIRTKPKTKSRQTKTVRQPVVKVESPEPLFDRSPTPKPLISSPPLIEKISSPVEIVQRVPEPEDALPEAPTPPQPTPKTKKKKKRSSNQFAIVTETVKAEPVETPEEVCPACKNPDDGDVMLACDICELWYHLRCTNLDAIPKDNEDWHCDNCTVPKSSARPTPSITSIPQASSKTGTHKTPKPSKSGRSNKKSQRTSEASTKSKSSELKAIHTPTPPPLPTPKHPTPPPQPAQAMANDDDLQDRPSVICTSQDDLCPECQLPDDGTLMIQCDDPACAKWFHGKCVNVLMEPSENDSWFCKVCVVGQQSAFQRRRRPI